MARDTARDALTTPSLRTRGTASQAHAPRVLVRIENVSKDYRLDEQVVTALHKINLNDRLLGARRMVISGCGERKSKRRLRGR